MSPTYQSNGERAGAPHLSASRVLPHSAMHTSRRAQNLTTLAIAATAFGCAGDGVLMDATSLCFGVLRGSTLRPAKSLGTSTPNWAARFSRCTLQCLRTFQFIFMISRSVCDESRMAWTSSADSGCGTRGRAACQHASLGCSAAQIPEEWVRRQRSPPEQAS